MNTKALTLVKYITLGASVVVGIVQTIIADKELDNKVAKTVAEELAKK